MENMHTDDRVERVNSVSNHARLISGEYKFELHQNILDWL